MTIVICTLGGEPGDALSLPASNARTAMTRFVSGGERMMYQVSVAIAATGRDVELRGDVSVPLLEEIATLAGARPRIGIAPRRPTPDDLVIVPEGYARPVDYARVALSPARGVIMVMAPPGLIGWPFVDGWTRPDPLAVRIDSVARPEHFQAMAAVGFELWTNSRGLAAASEAAGVSCSWIGEGWPEGVPGPVPKTHDVVTVEFNRWASLARSVVERLDATHRAIPRVPPREMLSLLGSGRILVFPSRVEGNARIPIEARSMGTVPVALDSNFAADEFDEASGVVTVAAVEEMPAAVQSLLADPPRLRELSERGRRTARLQVDWDRHVRRVDEVLRHPAPPDPGRVAREAMGRNLEDALRHRWARSLRVSLWGRRSTGPLMRAASRARNRFRR